VTIIFGTFDRSTASSAEVALSHSLQTAFAKFVKDPGGESPVPNWPSYELVLSGDSTTSTLAKIAYHGNVDLNNFVEPFEPHSMVSTGVKRVRSGLSTEWQIGWTVSAMGPIPGFPSYVNPIFGYRYITVISTIT